MHSEIVEQEWQYAASLGRPYFVRPVYWEDPLPESKDGSRPAPELRKLHFQKVFPTSKESSHRQKNTGETEPFLPPQTEPLPPSAKKIGLSNLKKLASLAVVVLVVGNIYVNQDIWTEPPSISEEVTIPSSDGNQTATEEVQVAQEKAIATTEAAENARLAQAKVLADAQVAEEARVLEAMAAETAKARKEERKAQEKAADKARAAQAKADA